MSNATQETPAVGGKTAKKSVFESKWVSVTLLVLVLVLIMALVLAVVVPTIAPAPAAPQAGAPATATLPPTLMPSATPTSEATQAAPAAQQAAPPPQMGWVCGVSTSVEFAPFYQTKPPTGFDWDMDDVHLNGGATRYGGTPNLPYDRGDIWEAQHAVQGGYILVGEVNGSWLYVYGHGTVQDGSGDQFDLAGWVPAETLNCAAPAAPIPTPTPRVQAAPATSPTPETFGEGHTQPQATPTEFGG